MSWFWSGHDYLHLDLLLQCNFAWMLRFASGSTSVTPSGSSWEKTGRANDIASARRGVDSVTGHCFFDDAF
jgi:hypothetical protein